MVSTLDFESSDPSSNLGRTYIYNDVENNKGWIREGPLLAVLLKMMEIGNY